MFNLLTVQCCYHQKVIHSILSFMSKRGTVYSKIGDVSSGTFMGNNVHRTADWKQGSFGSEAQDTAQVILSFSC